eukprot:346841-Pyramimonas_sp.AAC.1
MVAGRGRGGGGVAVPVLAVVHPRAPVGLVVVVGGGGGFVDDDGLRRHQLRLHLALQGAHLG